VVRAKLINLTYLSKSFATGILIIEEMFSPNLKNGNDLIKISQTALTLLNIKMVMTTPILKTERLSR
jgi:hypothetical protein